jgi:hypothetical protein
MLKRIKIIMLLSGFIFFLSGCRTSRVPVDYSYSKRNLKVEISGSWTEIKLNTKDISASETSISGELIAVQSDTVYVLTRMGLQGIHKYKINEAVVYMYKNQAGIYTTVTVLLYVPDIVAALITGEPYFLLIGVPWLILGGVMAMIEGSDETNNLIYPYNSQMQELKKFARYPQGMPPGIDKSRLHLITRN